MLLQELNGLPAGIRLRVMTGDDLPFLARLYASTRMDEVNQVEWPPGQKKAFLQQQFDAQHQHYQKHFSQAEFLVIEQFDESTDQDASGRPIGRLYLDKRDDEIRLIDIALLPEYRQAGLGSALLDGLLALARARGLDIRIHVEQFNPAAAWYRRYGFRLIEDRGVYLFMEWSPDT